MATEILIKKNRKTTNLCNVNSNCKLWC